MILDTLQEHIPYYLLPLGTVNVIEDDVDDSVFPFNVTDQDVPDGRPDSVNVTEYVFTDTGVNDIASFTFAPFTVTVPEDGDTVYPVMEPMVNEYVPLGTVNVIEDVSDCSVTPPSVTDHDVPDGRPDSVNVTEYLEDVTTEDK